MNNKVLNLDAEIKDNAVQDFHAYRLKFNAVFLAENYKNAFILSEHISTHSDLSESQLLELARNFLLLGYSDQAMRCLNRILSLNPNHVEAVLEKLKLLKNTELADEYIQLLKECIETKPANIQFYQMLFDCYTQLGMPEKSKELEAEARINGFELKQAFTHEISDHAPDTQSDIPFESPLFIENFLRLFQGRENAHARQWVSGHGNSGYNPIQEPLTHAKIRGHLMGLYTLGVYQLNLQNRVKWIVFDIDIAKEHLSDIHDPQFDAWIQEGFCTTLNAIKTVLDSYGIEALYEFSGFKGYHVWLMFHSEISAALAKSIAQKLASQFVLGAYPLNLEIFPKQSRISKSSYGNLVKLPGGIHKSTGLRSYFVRVEKEQLNALNIFDAINSVKTIDTDKLMELVHAIRPDISDPTEKSGTSIPYPNLEQPDKEFKDDPLDNPQWIYLKDRCFALQSIVSQVETNTALSADQKKVITYTIGTLPQGNAIVNAILKKASNWQSSDYLKSPLKGNSMSCNKIRKLLAIDHEDDACNCDFSALHPAYDSPVLHWELYQQNAALPAQNQKTQLRDTVSKYLEIKKKYQEYKVELKLLETMIYDLFEEIGVSEFDTGFGILKLTVIENLKTLSLIL